MRDPLKSPSCSLPSVVVYRCLCGHHHKSSSWKEEEEAEEEEGKDSMLGLSSCVSQLETVLYFIFVTVCVLFYFVLPLLDPAVTVQVVTRMYFLFGMSMYSEGSIRDSILYNLWFHVCFG